ncbi:tRNA pseudouridine(38-40) synthase TruA [Candidatus Palauibacter sp.]|uniref:tRNA pseudouridine(38-40) synthase TruA n=1 Tax=Candidatus Palauibacter sp. TaxID=3101350 RepID=UPI003B515BD4
MSDSTASLTRFRATIEYDGTSFHGSQLQPGVRTVQREVEEALGNLFDRPVRIDLAGRTDAGVHATAQEIAFGAPRAWSPEEAARALGATFPDDIAVRNVQAAGPDFHPRFDAEARRYRYAVVEGGRSRPLLRHRCWRPRWPLDLDALAGLAAVIPGERPFERFARSGQPERGTRCRVHRAAWLFDSPPFLFFEIVADRFLHHMVRYLVGTSVEIAAGRRPRADFERLLAGEAGTRAVFPAPPEGLYLTGVRYEKRWNAGPGIPWLPDSAPRERQ